MRGRAVARRLVEIAGLLLLAASFPHAVTAAAGTSRAENPTPGPRLTNLARMPNQMPFNTPALMQSQSTANGFLTLPYLSSHVVTSIFDHCNPDYTQDGKDCRFDGAIALKTNGVDPNFSLGYAMTPGGTDYLYYDGHNGYDYGLSYEPVLAAGDGIVRIAGSDSANPCFGQTVTIDHPNGYTTRYAHMSTIGVVSGQTVTRGQTVGISGNTGCSTGPHLHFGAYVTSSWTAIDPYGWAGPAGADPWPSDAGDLWLTGGPRYPLPDAPTNLLAIAGDASATVSWNPPAYTGGLSVQAYMVTASPGGQTTTVGPSATSAMLTGLSNGTTYTFTVVANNAVGDGTPSSPSNSIIPPAWPGRFHPLPPSRILDTRTAIGLGGHVGAGQTLDVPVLGVGGVPSSGVAAVAMNVTVTNPSDKGYLTVYPTGVARPLASNLDFVAGQTVANLVTVAVGTAGKVTIYNSTGGADVIFDLTGWVSAQGMTTVTAGQYRPLVPARILDTRGTIGRLGPDQAMDLQVAGQGGVPAAGASAVVLNVTVTAPSAASYLTVYPSGVSRPLSSNLGFVSGQTLANRVVVGLGTNGKVSLYNFAGSTDVVVDVGGWFTDGSSGGAGGEYTGVAPVRLLDTRTAGGPLGPGASLVIPVAGQVRLPALTSVTPPTAVVLNVTVTNPTAAGFLTVYPSGGSRPLASDLDFSPGQTVPNLVVVKLGADGKVALFNLAGSTDVVIDVLGWYD